MNTERPIREWYDLLPDPERSEAIEACENCAPYVGGYNAPSLVRALSVGFVWHKTKQGPIYWDAIHRRAAAGEFDAPSEVDLLRARIAELEGVVGDMIEIARQDEWDMAVTGRQVVYKNACTILNKK